ncbi:MAG: autoinducer 2 ABC transporter substrate-binding protein [Lachnospiraceae bacterium]|nr:autoinducer 2 ABC transporter substrate-binding protein [Lachnospiraceae bacterium]
MKKKLMSLMLAGTMVAGILGGTMTAKAEDDFTIVTIVKITGIAWFDRMEEGVNQFAEDTGIDAYQIGDSTADPAAQVQKIREAMDAGADAICVVPNSTESLEEVLKEAREKGIIVITHEASDVQNADYDIEAFDNAAYGRHFMEEQLGPMMDGKGKYTTFVGSLTATSHNEWVDASVAFQEENYPDMELVSNKNETTEDSENAYNITKQLLQSDPDIIGFQGSAMTDIPGVARAIEEMNLQDSTYVIGTSLVSTAGQYLETGAIDKISFWDPAKAGYAMNELALKMLKGEPIEDGMDLEAEGYQGLLLAENDKGAKVLYGQAWVDVTTENMDEYNF